MDQRINKNKELKQNLSVLIYSLSSGGAERVVSLLLGELKNRYNLTLILMNDTVFYDIPNDLRIVYLERSNPSENKILKLLKLPFLGYKYYKFCKKNHIDISLSFMNRPNYINVFSKIYGNTSKIIISERAMPSLQHKVGLQGIINRYLIKFLYPLADIVTANSLGNSMDLKKEFGIKKVQIINNLIDSDSIKQLSQEEVQINNDKFVFITIGRLDTGKNHELLIKAMQDIDAYLYIIGDGELRESLSSQIELYNLQNRVFLLGQKENPYAYLSKADCFVFSSKHEGFPNVILEALSCSLPVISTDCQSGPREILSLNNMNIDLKDNIEVAKYGVLIPIDNQMLFNKAMKLVMHDKKLCHEYQINSKEKIRDFSKKEIVKKWFKLIEYKLNN